MDKSKSRTDLLAAGKKKLQQFRQKKDSKGGSSHGQSSRKLGKSRKHGPDAGAATHASMSTASSQVTDGKVKTDTDSNLYISESSESESLANSLTPDFSAPSVNSSLATNNDGGGKLESASNTELALQAQRVGEHDSELLVQNEGESTQDVGADVMKDGSLRTSHSLSFEGGTTNDHMSRLVDRLSIPAPVTAAVGKAFKVDREGGDREESLLVSEDIPNTSELVENGGESTQDVGTDMVKDLSLRTSCSLGFECETMNDHMSTPVDMLSILAPVGEDKAFRVDERKGEDREESLLGSEDIPNTSLMQTIEDQEADGLDTKESYQSSDIEIDGQKNLALSKVSESAWSVSVIALDENSIEEASHEAEEIGEAVDVSSSLEDIESDRFSTSAKGHAIAIARPVMRHLERETMPASPRGQMLFQSTDERGSKEAVLSGEERGLQEGLDQQYSRVGLQMLLPPSEKQIRKEATLSGKGGLEQQYSSPGSVYLDKSYELSVEAQEINLARPLDVSSICDVSSISLLQLTELIRGLSEEEYNFLLNSRRAVSNADLVAGTLILPAHGFLNTFERLKEELFLANFMKNIFNLQLADQLEQQLESDNQRLQLIDELSEIRALHSEVSKKSQQLAEELSNCHVELQDIISTNIELQNQNVLAETEIEALFARVRDLQNSYEMSRKDASDLSTELADCKGLVTVFQAENKDMNESVAFFIEEKKKLLEEREYHLCESKKLSIELALSASKNVELQNQYVSAKAEIEALSARVFELQNSYEMSQKDALDLSTELADCRGLVRALQADNKDMNESVALMKKKLVEDKEYHQCESKKLSTELADIKSSVEKLKAENLNLNGGLSLLTEERNKIEAESRHLSHEIDRLSIELVESRDLVTSLKVENSNLNRSLALSADQTEMLEEDKQAVVIENQRLSSQIIVLQEQLSIENGERVKCEVELKEATMQIEQVNKENIFLKSTLDVHKANTEEIGNKCSQLISQYKELSSQAQIAGDQSEDLQIALTKDSLLIPLEQDEKGDPGGPPLNQFEHEVFTNSLGFVALKIHLDEVENILETLERAIDRLCSHSLSSGRSGGKISSAGVSKLIKAFELKAQQNEPEVEEKDSNACQARPDPLMFTKGLIGDLRETLTKCRLDVQNAGAFLKDEQDGRKLGEAKYGELQDQFEALNQRCLNLEASNIELAVQYEATKQLLGDIQGKKCHLEELCEALKQEDTFLKAKNNELYEKLGMCQSKISKLLTEIQDVQESSNQMASVIGLQLENLQKEVTDRARFLEQGWNATIAKIVEAVGKLDESVGEALSTTIFVSSLDGLDINHRLTVSVNAATEVIVDLRKKLDATYSEHETVCSSFREVSAKCDDLLGKNELAVGILHKIYVDLRKLVLNHGGSLDEGMVDIPSDALPDQLKYSSYQTIMSSLEGILIEKLELESVTKVAKSELMQREKELEELSIKCVGLDGVSKLIEDIEGELNVEDTDTKMKKEPLLHLVSLVPSLIQKTREADMQSHIAKEGYGSKVMELTELQEKIHYLDTLCLGNEYEILILKESLCDAEEALTATRSELYKKTSELEQSEQRVSSIREKLSIAVAKGKGLVVQRDGLKQSLAEISSKLERCLQELQLKDSRLHEVETKLKTYAEAGEHVEALESELSYIRHSANALRESFLLKDSVLQRIEEILEDLDFPEQFHSRHIIEKIDWLARSAASNSLPMNDWDHKSSAGGGSYSDAGFVVMDAWKDDGQLQSDSGDDFRKKFEDLETKYFELAEQNEMLEQSLMERNSLVQRWEELVDRIDMPSHLRSMETDNRIEWLGRALVEANHHIDTLQMKIEKYNSYSGLLNADLEGSQRRMSALQADLKAVTSQREYLSERVEALMYECEKLSMHTKQAELENEKLHHEITSLEERLEKKGAVEEQILIIEGKIRKLQDLICDVLQGSETESLISGSESIDSLEVLLTMLIENYATLSSTKPAYGNALDGHQTQEDDATLHEARGIDMLGKEEPAIASLKKELEEALLELMHVKEERDRNLEYQISLSSEVEILSKKTKELQELLNQEEQKSAFVREKLNVAVRKGKSLVQQRDGLKQTIEEINSEMARLKSKINNQEHTLAEYAEKFKDLSTYPDRLEVLESESLLLKNHLAETEHHLQERDYTLEMILNKLSEIEVSGEGDTGDPVKKLELVWKLCSDLNASVASLEQESRKSKRASELLLAELNEVQERNDAFQEELANVAGELADIRKERDSADAAKVEALSHLEKLSALQMKERNNYFSEVMGLRSSVKQLHTSFCEIGELLADVLFMNLESFQNLEAGLESCMKGNNAASVVYSSVTRGYNGILPRSTDNKKRALSVDSWSDFDKIDQFDDSTILEIFRPLGHQLQEYLMEVTSLKESINMHSSLTREQGKMLSKLVVSIQGEMTSQRESCEAMKKEICKKEGELIALCKNISYLHEACTNSVIVIENGKAELVGNRIASSDLGINFNAASFIDDGVPLSGLLQLMSEEYIKTVADRFLLAAKEFATLKTDFLDANQKETRATITNLQSELQKKDVQRERICMELVNQIKDAEAAANRCTQDLQSSRIREHNLEKQMEKLEAERKILEQRVNELQDTQAAAAEFEEKSISLTDLLAAKDQEIEALMHAFDEEEMRMKELTKKIDEFENLCQQKDLEIENLEASRDKLMRKLSITVSKFDELHHLSVSLLAEVEKLQSQLQERDADISFLRQEVTRCTNDVLIATQMNKKKSSDEIFELLEWIDMMLSREGMHDMPPDVKSDSEVNEYKDMLHKKLISVLSVLEDFRAVTESKDALLQVERSKVEELTHKAETLELSLRQKESQLNLLEGVEESGREASTSLEILEVEPVTENWTAAGTSVTPQMRSLRKGNNDHVTIAVDVDPGSTSGIEDEDDDKVHGFKSLAASRIVPRFTRPLTDMIDGLWVSCDRALMRQPTLRLGIIIYWAVMHLLLALSVV